MMGFETPPHAAPPLAADPLAAPLSPSVDGHATALAAFGILPTNRVRVRVRGLLS